MKIKEIEYILRLEQYKRNVTIINTKQIKNINFLLSVFIVGLYPIPLSLFINKYIIPNKIIIDYTLIKRYIKRFLNMG